MNNTFYNTYDPLCPKCGGAMGWVHCPNCENGYSHHDCGEDCCCCANPYPNVVCDVCHGYSRWWSCVGRCQSRFQKAKVKG
jgi:hypothetical protein